MGVNRIAVLWGFAEATLFFMTPIVWLSFAGRQELRRGLMACLFALAGAPLGFPEPRQPGTHQNRGPENNLALTCVK